MARAERSPIFFYFLLAGTAVLVLTIARPIASGLFIGAVLAGVMFPLQRRLARTLRRPALAATVLVAAVVITLLGPVVLVSTAAVTEARQGAQFIKETLQGDGAAGLIRKLPPHLQELATATLERLATNPDSNSGGTPGDQPSTPVEKAATVLSTATIATGWLLFQAAMMLIALFFLLIDGPRLIAWLDRTVPLRPGEIHELLSEFRTVLRSVIVASVICAGVQTAAALVGYLIARVPSPLFFAGVTFVVALIPVIGAATVCLVAAGLLYFTGHPMAAAFLALWALGVVALIDNVVTPYLVAYDIEMHGAVVFFSMVGGILVFGAVGLLVGPLVANLFLTLMRMYRRNYKSSPQTRAAS